MARIPDHEIERLKKEISVERLAEARVKAGQTNMTLTQ
jgi:hypothetical protein